MSQARIAGDATQLALKLSKRTGPTGVVRGPMGGFVLYDAADIDSAVGHPGFIGVYDASVVRHDELRDWLMEDLRDG